MKKPKKLIGTCFKILNFKDILIVPLCIWNIKNYLFSINLIITKTSCEKISIPLLSFLVWIAKPLLHWKRRANNRKEDRFKVPSYQGPLWIFWEPSFPYAEARPCSRGRPSKQKREVYIRNFLIQIWEKMERGSNFN